MSRPPRSDESINKELAELIRKRDLMQSALTEVRRRISYLRDLKANRKFRAKNKRPLIPYAGAENANLRKT